MTKRCSMLQKKLKELQDELTNHVFSHPPHLTEMPRAYSLDIEQRFEFLKKLLSAENASSHGRRPNNPHHLQHIGNRISLLESAFYDWKNKSTKVDAALFDWTNNDVENVSTCSCTKSCLNDDVECGDQTTSLDEYLVSTREQFEEPAGNAFETTPLAEDQKQTTLMEKEKEEEEEETAKVAEERSNDVVKIRGRLCWAMASGIGIGMAVMGFVTVGLCRCNSPHYVEKSLCLVPT